MGRTDVGAKRRRDRIASLIDPSTITVVNLSQRSPPPKPQIEHKIDLSTITTVDIRQRTPEQKPKVKKIIQPRKIEPKPIVAPIVAPKPIVHLPPVRSKKTGCAVPRKDFEAVVSNER